MAAWVPPYSFDTNDMHYHQGFHRFVTARDFCRLHPAILDTLWREGERHPKMMSIGLHLRAWSVAPPHRRPRSHRLAHERKAAPGSPHAARSRSTGSGGLGDSDPPPQPAGEVPCLGRRGHGL